MAFHDGDWVTMIKITDKVKISEDTRDLIMGIAECLKQLPQGRKDSEDNDRHYARSDTAKVSVSLSLPEFNGAKGQAAK